MDVEIILNVPDVRVVIPVTTANVFPQTNVNMILHPANVAIKFLIVDEHTNVVQQVLVPWENV